MTVSKIDLLNKKFTRAMRGYAPEEVDFVMHEAAEALGDLADANRRLLERQAELERELARAGQSPRPPFQGALAAGRKIVSDIQEKAPQDALRIVEDARVQAERILADANRLKARVMEEIGELQGAKTIFESRMRTLLEEHFRLLEAGAGAQENPSPEGEFTFVDGQE